ncbi:uncharacterized protein LOC143375046 isoform X1 [Andrena cerasifolii]|uniref:uncharacterized protein LOC143375046 isoform X1 n=1 Tax=Andrena cerasifolii TaxID=2819439 RepID=UPI00403818E0
MTPSLCTCTWLLLPCCVLITLSTGELKFYRDEVPESPERIALRQLIKYLEEHPQRSYFNPVLASQPYNKHQLVLSRQKAKDLLEALANKGGLADFHRKEKLKGWNYQQTRYSEPLDELPREREHYLPYYELNLFGNPLEYPRLKLPYPREDASPRNDGYEYGSLKASGHFPYEGTRDLGKGMKEEPVMEFPASYDELVNEDEKPQKVRESRPEFTFNFDDANLEERHPFAVKPNDPRYYQDAPFFSGDSVELGFKKVAKNDSKWSGGNGIVKDSRAMHQDGTRNAESKFEEASVLALPELERRTGHNPLVVPVNHDLNNDIYFIAIVAGCSAAAMFALVLITLTWCRLKRGAKAAADIEYPAYGVTGPNKEVSPSGDQRLAQSAQMYHFQHQKQQIIAMENNNLCSRVSASRDPGSVSEADSEEENEEGDYTVYECPGLASTGEMEVKNPLFHDDPTPATPAQTNKEEDHI